MERHLNIGDVVRINVSEENKRFLSAFDNCVGTIERIEQRNNIVGNVYNIYGVRINCDGHVSRVFFFPVEWLVVLDNDKLAPGNLPELLGGLCNQ